MKKTISCVLALLLIISNFSVNVFAEKEEVNIDENLVSQESASIDKAVDLSETYNLLDDNDSVKDYSVNSVTVNIDEMKITVSYTAIKDSAVELIVYNDENDEQYDRITSDIKFANKEIEIIPNLKQWPNYFAIDVTVCDCDSSVPLSGTYTYLEHTKKYAEFMNTQPDDELFNGQEVLHYGENTNGGENFAVVREDVNVVYIDSVDDLKISDAQGKEISDVSLMSVENTDTKYEFPSVNKNSELYESLSKIDEGEKVLVVPRDHISSIVAFEVGEKENVELFNNNENVSFIEDDTIFSEEDLFDFIKIDVDIAVTANDIIPADGVIAEEDEQVELFGILKTAWDYRDFFWNGTKDKPLTMSPNDYTKTFTLYNKNGTTIRDTLTLSGAVHFSCHFSTYYEYWGIIRSKKHKVNDLKATVDVSVTNTLNLNMQKNAKINASLEIGSLFNIGIGKHLRASAPISVDFNGNAKAQLSTSLTQRAGGEFGIKYENNCATKIIKSDGFSSNFDFKLQGDIYAEVGVSVGVEVVAGKKLDAEAKGAVGVSASGHCENGRVNDTEKHECDFCLDGTLNWFVRANVKVVALDKTIVDQPFFSKTGKIADFYVSYDASRNPKWNAGRGDCNNKSYKVVVKVQNKKSGKAIKDATVKYGSTSLGKTNSKGKVTGWLYPGTYKFKASKTDYNSVSASKYVGVSGLNLTMKMSPKSGANEMYYTLDDIFDLSDDEYSEFIADDAYVSNCLFQIRNADDLQQLATLVNDTGRDTDKLRFVINNAERNIDLSGIDWEPIGNATAAFKGEFNGNNSTITGLTINESSGYNGLFGNVNNAEIFDLGVVDANISGNINTGILAGLIQDSKIYDSYVTGSVLGSNNVGGLAGSVINSEVLNCYNKASVSGNNNVGGLVGQLECTDTKGQLANSYNVGIVEGNDAVGAIIGVYQCVENPTQEQESPEELEAIISDVPIVGIQYCYYLTDSSENAIGETIEDDNIYTYAISQEQATGINSNDVIAQGSKVANVYTLLDALNNWYEVFGLNTAPIEGAEEIENVELTSEGGSSDDTSVYPLSDSYNKWYEDTAYANNGYPMFETNGQVYSLSVEYLYQNGTEAKPPVTLYLTEGQPYDVDSYTIDGYYTDNIQYAGLMPDGDTTFRVIYIKIPTDISVSNLYSEYLSDGVQAQNGSICYIYDKNDLVALSNYVNTGANTNGVIFALEDDIDMADTVTTPIGSEEYPFRGTFNGYSHSINNYSNSTYTNNVGLFGVANQATIKNLIMDSACVVGLSQTGCLIGKSINSEIINIDISAEVQGQDNVGNLVGYSQKTKYNNITAIGDVIGANNTGGLIGYQTETELTNIQNETSVTATGNNIGGIVGNSISSSIKNGSNWADVIGNTNVGGCAGNASASVIENTYNAGLITGNSATGDFAGVVDTGIYNCFTVDAETLVGNGNINGIVNIDSDNLEPLYAGLNNWVKSKESSIYVEWIHDDITGYPVLGAEYTNWIKDFELTNSEVKFKLDATNLNDATIYVATYDENGGLLNISMYRESGSFSIPVTSGVKSAKAFIWDSNLSPLDECRLRQ